MPRKAVTLIVRMWQNSDGTTRVSVKPAGEGETRNFVGLNELMEYLKAIQNDPKPDADPAPGLR